MNVYATKYFIYIILCVASYLHHITVLIYCVIVTYESLLVLVVRLSTFIIQERNQDRDSMLQDPVQDKTRKFKTKTTTFEIGSRDILRPRLKKVKVKVKTSIYIAHNVYTRL